MIGSARGLLLPGTPISSVRNALIGGDGVPTGEIAQRAEIPNFTGDSKTSRSRREHETGTTSYPGEGIVVFASSLSYRYEYPVVCATDASMLALIANVIS